MAAERLRVAVGSRTMWVGGREQSETLSAGVAERTAAMTDPPDLILAASAALDEAKAAGGNCVRVARAET